MSCKPISRLFPLYVEGDLRARQAERVRIHLGSCLPCRALLEGYRASQRALHAAAHPEISGATLEDFRRGLWRRISSLPPRSALGRQLDRGWATLRHWAAQPAMAAVVVFLVVGGSFALSRVTGPGARSEMRLGAAPGRADETPIVDETGAEERASEGDDSAEPMLAQASFDDTESGEPVGEGPADEGTPGDDSLRIEIQTRDPDVRIIWFSPTEDHGAGAED
jgi:anti-sigma factor RsiW